jgi:hypothetical protein
MGTVKKRRSSKVWKVRWKKWNYTLIAKKVGKRTCSLIPWVQYYAVLFLRKLHIYQLYEYFANGLAYSIPKL